MKLYQALIIMVIVSTPWIWNLAKLTDCDFKSDYKCEAIHSIGVFMPPAAFITVWFGTDE